MLCMVRDSTATFAMVWLYTYIGIEVMQGAFPDHMKSITLVYSCVMSGLGIKHYTVIFKSKQLTALTPILYIC